MSMTLNQPKKLAIYAAADDAYVPKAVMALRSFQRWHAEFAYFLLATENKLSEDSLQFIKKFNIELIDVDQTHRFAKLNKYKYKYPLETVVKLYGPEILAGRGYPYSLVIDGDVYCAAPMQLEDILGNIQGYAGRVVGPFSRTIDYKQKEKNPEFDFSLQSLHDTLGIEEALIGSHYEVNGGVLFWNNDYMAKLGMFDKVATVFQKCYGCFLGGQDLFTFTTAAYKIPFLRLSDAYNYNFFEDFYPASMRN